MLENEMDLNVNNKRIGRATVKVIGVGGGGSNAVNRMYSEELEGIEYICVNTDAQHLLRVNVENKVQMLSTLWG